LSHFTQQTFRKLFFWTFLFFALPANANELVVEGSAIIVNGDLGQAREMATRRALARASEQKSANISASTTVRPDAVFDTIQLRSSACTENAEQLSERIVGDELTIVMRVTLVDGPNCLPSCRGAYTNKLLVTGFAMEFPEQKLVTEQPWISQLTAVELARKIRQSQQLLVDFKGEAFPYSNPARAPEAYVPAHASETMFAALGKHHRAQYILSGVYRDFGLNGFFALQQTRRIEIEAFIHDAINGEMLSRQSFVAEASGSVQLSNKPTFGSAAFYQGDFGRAWGPLLDRIAAWAKQQAACLPLSSHVISVSGKTIHIASGSESGLSVGDTLNLHSWKEPPVRNINGAFLGKEKRLRATASIRAVYPKFSIIEISNFPKDLIVKPGDILYVE
jgi:hypothetical protein